MPIPVSKLAEAQLPLKERLLHFLRRDPENAYADFELFCELEEYDPTDTALMLASVTPEERSRLLEPYATALGELVETKAVQSAVCNGSTYYYCPKVVTLDDVAEATGGASAL